MKRIYKYVVGEDIIKVPIKRFLDAQMQDGHIVVWAEVDDSYPEKSYALWARWTGEPFPDGIYIGTVQDGWVVYHIYAVESVDEKIKKAEG